MDDRNEAESMAWEIVTAVLIARDEAADMDDVRTKDDAEAWLSATRPFTDLVDDAVDRIEGGETDFGLDLIYELANLMALSMEGAAATRRHYAGKTVNHGTESTDLTGLEYWRSIIQERIKGDSA